MHILVPTDFSPAADTALDFALQMSRNIPVRLTVLHSFEVSENIYVDYMGVNKEFNATVLNEAKNRLEEMKERIIPAYDLEMETVVSTEPLQIAIERTVEEEKVTFIVMGTLGASGLKSKLWGSRTSAAIGKTKVPIFAIPAEYTWSKPRNILLATNQFERKPEIMDFLFEWADLLMARVQIVVFTDEAEDSAKTFSDRERQLADYRTFLRETYREDQLEATQLLGQDFEETMEQFHEEHDTDVLVMVTYRHSFWERFSNPSKSKRMSYRTKIPLLILPAHH